MTRAIILTMALGALAISVIASNAANTSETGPIVNENSCDRQIWPNFSEGCLLTIQGKKSDRKFRQISF